MDKQAIHNALLDIRLDMGHIATRKPIQLPDSIIAIADAIAALSVLVQKLYEDKEKVK